MCKLVKSLNGLKQAAKQWLAKFDHIILSNDSKINECNKYVYIKNTPNKVVIVSLYVEDISIIRSNIIANINTTKHMFSSKFNI